MLGSGRVGWRPARRTRRKPCRNRCVAIAIGIVSEIDIEIDIETNIRSARAKRVFSVVSHECSDAIRRTRSDEADLLSELAFRSKAHWGYPKNFMEACRSELTLSPSYVEGNPTFGIESEGHVVGFYSLEALSASEVELGYLFVEPAYIGHGFGRRLIDHAKREAQSRGYRAQGFRLD